MAVHRGRYDGLYLQWPELQTLRHAQYVPEQWDRVLRKAISDIVGYEDKFAQSSIGRAAGGRGRKGDGARS